MVDSAEPVDPPVGRMQPVPKKSPLGTIKDVADVAVASVVSTVTESVKDPVGTGQRMVGSAVGQAAAVAGAVSTRLPRRKRAAAPKVASRPVAVPQAEPRKTEGDPVTATVKAPAQKATAKRTPAKKTPAKKAPAKKTPANKTVAKKTAAKKTPAKKAPAKKTSAKKSAAVKKG